MHRAQSVTRVDLYLQQCRGLFVPPFPIWLLVHVDYHGADASRRDPGQLLLLLPASYHTESDDVAAPALDVTACVVKELDLRRLTRIHSWLWVAGRPMPPRWLHHQRLLAWEIFVAKQMDMYLVWTMGCIFLKPIPRFLSECCFWAEHLCFRHGCDSAKDGGVGRGTAQKCADSFGARAQLLILWYVSGSRLASGPEFGKVSRRADLPHSAALHGWHPPAAEAPWAHRFAA
ncbi:hypothetical protein GQ53DRAFT_842521 [Thozetella sp. PMI_491]|nr:hypothetical protein GQ53DRAFT_842521 [Thozetella sp. PMI_491]